MAEKPLRVGIAGAPRGAGYVVGARAAAEAGLARLDAVYDPDAEAAGRFAAEHGLETTCRSFEELIGAVDLVVLSSPQHHHVPQAVAALGAGVHVLSEVPAAVSLEQATELVGAVRASSARYMMAENYCYTRPNLVVAAMARSGAFGDLYYGEGEYIHEVRNLQRTAGGERTWRSYWQAGRNGVTYPTHSLGPLVQWFGDRVVAVSCVGSGRHTAPEHEIEDTVVLLARTSRGALLRIRLDMLSNRPHLMDYFSLQGTAGAYEAPRSGADEPRVYLHGQSPEGTWEPLSDYAERFLPDRYADLPAGAGHGGGDAWPLLDLARAVREGETPPIDVYSALDMSLPGIASEDSIASGGTWCAVPDPRRFTAGVGTAPGSEAPLA